MKIFQRLFCKHEYKYSWQHPIDWGMGKAIYHKCSKCGKVKVKVI